MLKPDDRAHLVELLRPPADCRFDCAIGTTFSLDLMSALMLPLSFALFDWEENDGELTASPLALLEALRRYGDRFTVFCQNGQIHLPSKYERILAFLEPCIYGVEPPDPKGLFHPKLWVLRFLTADQAVRYRVLCLSRNLTFDRCWDTVVALDGELLDRTNAISANRPLSGFVKALPGLATRRLSRDRRRSIEQISDELKRVRFSWPDGFEECRFWSGGLDGSATAPFGAVRKKSLIVSPFVSDGVIGDFLEYGETHLVSRPESLDAIPRETLKECNTVRVLSRDVGDENANDDLPALAPDEVLDGLHAKLFVIDRGWDASVFTGSFNATSPALEHNVEFMVELVGKKSRFGVDQFLREVKGETNFSDLLECYKFDVDSAPPESQRKQLDDLLQAAKRAIGAARPWLQVTPAEGADRFDVTLHWKTAPAWPDGKLEIRTWPISLRRTAALPIDKTVIFSRLSFAGLTPLVAFSISAKIGETSAEIDFVMNLSLEGAPEDRHDRILRSLIENQDQLLRYILFLLAAGDETDTLAGDLRRLLDSDHQAAQNSQRNPYLLETTLRALHRNPAQLERVASLLDVLRKAPGGSELLSDNFQKMWNPIWDATRQTVAK